MKWGRGGGWRAVIIIVPTQICKRPISKKRQNSIFINKLYFLVFFAKYWYYSLMSDLNTLDGISSEEEPKRKRGRPRKPDRLLTRQQWEDEGKKAKGRPKGMRTAIKKLEERLLSANRIEHVIDAIVKAAEDPEHKNQAAAWKLIMDRMAPLSHYDKTKGNEKPVIQINVSSIDRINTDIQEIEGEIVE